MTYAASVVTSGDLSIKLITHGEPHCVNSMASRLDGATIQCACGLMFVHRDSIEAAKAWYEHRYYRTQTTDKFRAERLKEANL